MAVTNCSKKKSFSTLGRIKNFLRFTLRQNKMRALALLFIECEFMENISVNEPVELFTSSKSKKNDFL